MANSPLSIVAKSIVSSSSTEPEADKIRISAVDKDAEWQRVNSYVADVLKDSHVLYAKLARLQGDFVGEELDTLMKISEAVLSIGEELSGFSKAFYEGKLQMADSEFRYGEGGQPQNLPTPAEASPVFEPFDGGGSQETPKEEKEGKEDSEEGKEDYSGEEDEGEEDYSGEEDKK